MTQLYEIDGYHYIVDLTPYFVLGVLAIALVCAIAVLVRRILASPFRYPTTWPASMCLAGAT